MDPGHVRVGAGCLLAVLLATACTNRPPEPAAQSAADNAGDPAETEVGRAAARGLPTRLVPADLESPDYEPPRMRCAPELRDRDAGARLHLVQQLMRHDRWQRGDTAVTVSYAEGLYSVEPPGQYGLERGQLLRVNCARQAATAVLSDPS